MAKARYVTKRNLRRRSLDSEVVETAKLIGFDLMDWQRDLLGPAMEWRADGRPFHKTVTCTVPRQQGKSVLVSAVAVHRALSRDDQRIVLLAQTRGAASERLADVALKLSRAGVEGVKWYRGVGNEHVSFANGSRIDVESPNIHGGHGASYDLVVLDEAWSLEPHTLQGLLPTQAALEAAQLWIISTQGTEDSITFGAFIDAGRESVTDRTSPIAYTEFAADEDAGDDIFDREQWGKWMPALGVTVRAENIEPSMLTMSPGEFKRAYGNVLTQTDSEWIPGDWWLRSFDGFQARTEGSLVFGFDTNLEPAGSCISVAWKRADGGWHVEVVAYEAGEGSTWLESKVKELVASWSPVGVVSVGGAPVREIAARVKAFCVSRAVPFRSLSMQDFAASSQGLYEALRVEAVSHGDSAALDSAVARVRIRESGDLWRFDRKASRVDLSPVVSVAAALFGAQEADASRGRYEVSW